MRLSRKQAFGIAAAVALIAAVLVYVVLNSRKYRPPVPAETTMVTVVMAKTTIPAYEEIKQGDVEAEQVPREQAPANALDSPADAVGRISQAELTKGQALTRADVGPRSADLGLTFVIPEGMRALTVALDPISGVGGFVIPGDRVDVLATLTAGKDQAVTRTILQDVKVLAMNKETVRPAVRKPAATDEEGEKEEEAPAAQEVESATLAVTPHEAQILILSSSKGTIHLVLRAREDREYIALEPSNEWSLTGMKLEEIPSEGEPEKPAWPEEWGPPPGAAAPGEEAPEEAEEEAPPPPTVTVISGGERQEVVVGR